MRVFNRFVSAMCEKESGRFPIQIYLSHGISSLGELGANFNPLPGEPQSNESTENHVITSYYFKLLKLEDGENLYCTAILDLPYRSYLRTENNFQNNSYPNLLRFAIYFFIYITFVKRK